MSVLTTSPSLVEAITPTVTETPNENSVTTPEPETPKEEPLSARFAALARKQKLIDQEKQKVKLERSTIDADRAEYLKWKEEQAKPKAKKNPIEALMSEGWTYEDAANFVMNDNKITPELKIKEFESKLERMEREAIEKEEAKIAAERESQTQAQAQAIENFKASINDFVTQNADSYELIALHEAQAPIYDTINAHYEDTKEKGAPKILSTKEAADMVEAYLEEQVEKSYATKKLQAKLKPVDGQKDPEPKSGAFTSKTFTNATTPTSSSPRAPAKTDAERIQRALALLG